LVYSTDFGSICPLCGKPKKNCICRELKRKAIPETPGVVRIRYETSGRKGKGVTLISGLSLNQEELFEIAKRLKQKLGTGGTVKDYVIELQGDHRAAVETLCKSLINKDKDYDGP